MEQVGVPSGPDASVEDNQPRSRDVPGLLQVHLAEYNALTTRATYWLTLQFAVWPIVMGLWGLLALLLGKLPDSVVFWGGALMSQAFGLMWYGVTIEIYRTARYIERELKPRVSDKLDADVSFWNYECRNHDDRGDFLPLVWEWPVAVGGLMIVTWVSTHLLPWQWGDYLAFLVSATLAGGMIVAALAAGKVRRQITDGDL